MQGIFCITIIVFSNQQQQTHHLRNLVMVFGYACVTLLWALTNGKHPQHSVVILITQLKTKIYVIASSNVRVKRFPFSIACTRRRVLIQHIQKIDSKKVSSLIYAATKGKRVASARRYRN